VCSSDLSNAVKFTPEGGRIRLDASLAGETGGECTLRVEVEDSGIGISPKQQARLFRAFEQAESGTSREYGGTGLGLTISKRIVEMMGGDIRVESDVGKGARFIFTVKARRGEKDPAQGVDAGLDDAPSIDKYSGADSGEEPARGDDDFRGKRMLLAEDVEINREILITLLEDTGIAIDCAENGKEALDMVEAGLDKYDIVFMDVQMPQMDGLEAARRIRALPGIEDRGGRGRLPIVAMTANVFKSDIDACIEAGMDGHLGKPLDFDKVMGTLGRYLKPKD
jgi:CheY-like chemotaxis protein